MKRFFPLLIICLGASISASAQKGNKEIASGNKAYQTGHYKDAADQYAKALKVNPNNELARYNLANALQRQKNSEAAEKAYQQVAKKGNPALQPKAYYNNGVAQAKNKELKEAIESFKNSLRRAPQDNDARENLQKAINDLKQQNKDKNENKKDPKKPPQNQQDKNQQQPQSPKEKKDQQRMDQLLNQLREQEKDLQKKLQSQKNNQVKQPAKDW